ncbi:MAG: MarR family transcriptional regulator [Chloroflexota bacterium]
MENSSEEQAVNYSYLPDLLGHLVGLAHLQATQRHAELLKSLNLTPKQFVALEFISNNSHISQREIADHIGTTPAVMVNILDFLTERSFVERIRSPKDRRQHHIRVTEGGLALLDELKRIAFEAEAILDEETGLTAEERIVALGILQKITKRCL